MIDTAAPASRRRPPRFRALRALWAVMLREMATSYGRSFGGYAWALIQPIAAIALLSYAFSLFLRAPSLGTSFPLFYATGYLPFAMWQDMSNKIALSIRFSKSLLAFGALTWSDLILARFALNALTNVVIIALVLGGLAIFWPMPGTPDFPVLINSIAMVSVLSLGLGMLNCFLYMTIPVWEHIFVVLTRPLFIASGIFFIFEDIPVNFRDPLWYNPLIHVTGEMRRAVYPTYEASYVSPSYVYGLGVALLLIGLFFFHRFQDYILDQ